MRNPIRIRPAASMLTLAEASERETVVDGFDGLLAHLVEHYDFWGPTAENVEVKPHGFDRRNGWDAHLVTVDGKAALFCDGPVEREPLAHAIAIVKRVELTPEQRDGVNAVIDAVAATWPEPPCPYGSGVHRASHEILCRREWQLPFQNAPIAWRVAAVLVSGAAGDYAAYMAIADDDAWVADHGTKLGFDEAAALFPGITQRRYRP